MNLHFKGIRRILLIMLVIALLVFTGYGIKTQPDAEWTNMMIGNFLTCLGVAFSYFFKEEKAIQPEQKE